MDREESQAQGRSTEKRVLKALRAEIAKLQQK